MSEKPLRQQLVGAYELCRTRHRGGRGKSPFGEHPLGLILYTPDGRQR